ncbi:DUF6415 family natural product biosynthesis protein [Streptomyces sp. NPDC002285]
MRTAAAHALGPDDGPEALPASASELNTLTATLREYLELLAPEVARIVGPKPYSVKSYCALACVGEAHRTLRVTPGATLELRVAHARKQARALAALCDHYERIGGPAS